MTADSVEIDVQLPHNVHRTNLADMVTDIVKSVLLQRCQIPVNFDKLAKQIYESSIQTRIKAKSERPSCGVSDVTNTYLHRKNKKSEKENARKQKVENRFNKKAAVFVQDCDKLLSSLKEKISEDGDKIHSVRILLGATTVSAKAAYKIVFPKVYSEFPIENFKSGRVLFKSMVANEHIVEVNRERIPATNMFVYIEMKSLSSPTASSRFIPTSEPREPSKRTRNVSINILSKKTDARSSNLFTPFPKMACRPYGRDSFSQVSMELCTPQINLSGKRQRKYSDGSYSLYEKKVSEVRKRHMSIEVFTPCGKESMELFTPIPGGGRDFCTPMVQTVGGNGSMELCTPATRSRLPSSGLLPSFSSAETATGSAGGCPPQRNVLKRLNLQSSFSDTDVMDLCTPAHSDRAAMSTTPTRGVGVRGGRSTHASMEMCTPFVARKPTTAGGEEQLNTRLSRMTVGNGESDTERLPHRSTASSTGCEDTSSLQAPAPRFWLKWPVGIKGLSVKGYT